MIIITSHDDDDDGNYDNGEDDGNYDDYCNNASADDIGYNDADGDEVRKIMTCPWLLFNDGDNDDDDTHRPKEHTTTHTKLSIVASTH